MKDHFEGWALNRDLPALGAHPVVTLADNECKHGSLPQDRNLDCDCWAGWKKRRSARASTKPPFKPTTLPLYVPELVVVSRIPPPPTTQNRGKRGCRSRLTDVELRYLYQLHLAGVSARELGRRVYRVRGYASEKSALEGVSKGWKRLGLKARGRIEMTVLVSTKHGLASRDRSAWGEAERAHRIERRRATGEIRAKRCEGKRTSYPDKGGPCRRWALRDSDFCYYHDSETQEQVRDLEAAR